MKLVENECSIVVSYTNNKCAKFEIFEMDKKLEEKPIEKKRVRRYEKDDGEKGAKFRTCND